MKVFVDTDMEGVSGITTFAQCGRDPDLYQKEGRPLQMHDLYALTEGLVAGGAGEIVISDGHGSGCNFMPDLMHPKAKYFTGTDRPGPAGGLDESFDCAVLLGFHSMNGTERGLLHHTQSDLAETKYWYNGIECGEIAQASLMIGHFGVPVVMVTGDVAACEEARRFLGDSIVTVAVKAGLSRQCGVLISPKKAHEMIREGAIECLKRVEMCQPFRMDLPIEGKLVVQNLEYAATYGENLSRKINENTWVATFMSQLDIAKF